MPQAAISTGRMVIQYLRSWRSDRNAAMKAPGTLISCIANAQFNEIREFEAVLDQKGRCTQAEKP